MLKYAKSVAAVEEGALQVSVCTYTSVELKYVENYCYWNNARFYPEHHLSTHLSNKIENIFLDVGTLFLNINLSVDIYRINGPQS
jgi:hypothetical protein